MRNQPRTVVFDVFETLISLEPLRDRFTEVGLTPEMLERWFDRTLRDGMALSLAGDYEPFPVVAKAALRTLARGRLNDDAVHHVLAGIPELPAHSDVEPAMRQLADAGITMVCLTHGTAKATANFLEYNGLAHYIDQVISVSEVGSWKPPRRVYDHAVARLGQKAHEVALVAVHAFDCHGAKKAGLTTGWASRLDGHYAEVFLRPDVTGADLSDVAAALLKLGK